MNKDVIYIEPEEDITDVISKIGASKSKIVAIVPPKKSGVFRSIVNIKLIAKAAANTKKAVVLVTTDPSVMKLAAATKIPVTKDLSTAPAVPDLDEEIDDTEVVDVEEDASEAEEETEDKEDTEDAPEEEDEVEADTEEESADETDDEPEAEDEKAAKKSQKEAKKATLKALKADARGDEDEEPKHSGKKSDKPARGLKKLKNSENKVLKWIGTHPKITAGIGAGCVVLILFMIWAFGIAPAVKITLELETTTGNFSENITFTETLSEEDVTEGKFYIEEKKSESKAEVEFEATGTKNVGEKATGTLKVTHYFPLDEDGGSVVVSNGATFTNSGLTYTVTSGATIKWDGDLKAIDTDCENHATSGWKQKGCAVSATVTVTASDSGAKYNIAGTSAGWSSSVAGLDLISSEAMTGGSDKTVTVVQQSDIDEALKKISTENEAANREKLLDDLEEDQFAIESSFKQTTSEPVSSPAVGEEVEEGKKAKLTVTTTDTMFVLDETKLKEFITEKAKLNEGYKIYEMKSPFVENFTKVDSGYIGKLKTSYIAGSTITENEVVETVKGKGIGTAKRDLSDNFRGIKTITIDTSVPWVTSVPGNAEKITVQIDVKE